ncbi:hypothetical protein [Paenibacillus sp. YYML68]|uniref:hypothetical protein n=1 Tax=Paenibacillus sp. YYML68 TaxID=2909250 RepID=UPI0037C75C68
MREWLSAPIGDGAIVVAQERDMYSWVFWPDHREYENTDNQPFTIPPQSANTPFFSNLFYFPTIATENC